eukprot:TRINITY_DN5817_c0_g1_i2.p3 TRINITY_DN5817_c0_g1~~TRINITY_DN5817_c0_g1_i2.p3  ORF type:complete len:240 (-),score=11.35 TRINITY_DN5817_c0_g1_i2:1227-1856(-)
MAAYIQKQLDILQCTPVDLRRRLETIHEVDEQIVGLKRQVVQSLETEVKSKRTKVSKNIQEELDRQLQKMRSLQNRKIEIARNLQQQIALGAQQIERDLRSLRAHFEEEKRLGIYDQKRNQNDNQTPLPSTLPSSKPPNKKRSKLSDNADDQCMDIDHRYDQMDYDNYLHRNQGDYTDNLLPRVCNFKRQISPQTNRGIVHVIEFRLGI